MTTKPTQAAMRAAKSIINFYDSALIPEWQESIGGIIDRETGLPELLEACKCALTDFEILTARGDLCDEDHPNGYPRALKTMEMLKSALTKSEREPVTNQH